MIKFKTWKKRGGIPQQSRDVRVHRLTGYLGERFHHLQWSCRIWRNGNNSWRQIPPYPSTCCLYIFPIYVWPQKLSSIFIPERQLRPHTLTSYPHNHLLVGGEVRQQKKVHGRQPTLVEKMSTHRIGKWVTNIKWNLNTLNIVNGRRNAQLSHSSRKVAL